MGALCGLTVQAARDHKDPRRQHQHKEDSGHQVHPHHIGIAAEAGKPQQGGILREGLVSKTVLLPPPVQHLAGIGAIVQPHKPDRGHRVPFGVGQACKGVPVKNRPHHAGVAADGHIGAEAGNGIDELSRRGVEGDFVPHLHREHRLGPPGEKDFVPASREVSLGQIVVNFGQDGLVAAHHHAGLAVHGVVLRQGGVQPVVPGKGFHLRFGGDGVGGFLRQGFQHGVPVAVGVDDPVGLHPDGHIRHAEDGRDQQHRHEDAEHRHPVLAAAHLSGKRNQAQIALHARHLPKSVTTPSDTCRIRSAVWAMVRLWVIMTMVCS